MSELRVSVRNVGRFSNKCANDITCKSVTLKGQIMLKLGTKGTQGLVDMLSLLQSISFRQGTR